MRRSGLITHLQSRCMTTIELIGNVTENGELRAKVPSTVRPGEVRITLELPEDSSINEPSNWTDTELEELLIVQPSTGPEIVEFLNSPEYEAELNHTAWANIADGAFWVEEHRRQRRAGCRR